MTSILSMLGISSPFVAALIKFVFREYNKLMSAAALIEAYDARFEELDTRLRKAGIADPDVLITRQIAQLKGSLKESFNRRDLRIQQMETKVEVIKQAQVESESKHGRILVPNDIQKLSVKTTNLDKQVQLLTNLQKSMASQMDALSALTSAPSPTAVPPSPELEAEARRQIKELETQVVILKRALIKLATKMKVDLSFELHQNPTKAQATESKAQAAPAPSPGNGVPNGKVPGEVIDYKAMAKDRSVRVAREVDEEKLLAELKTQLYEEEE